MNDSKKRKYTGRTAAAIIIKEPELILLVKRLTIPFSGYWALPGGKQDPGETIEQTIIREVKEETGFNIKIIKKIGEYREKGNHNNVEYDYSPTCFLAEIIGGELDPPADEIEEVRWFTVKELKEGGNYTFGAYETARDYFKGDYGKEYVTEKTP